MTKEKLLREPGTLSPDELYERSKGQATGEAVMPLVGFPFGIDLMDFGLFLFQLEMAQKADEKRKKSSD